MAKRKFESILELKERGLNIGEMDEFTYRQLDDALEYAKELIEKFGGFSLRTDFPPGDTRVRMALPVLKDPTLENLKEFIEENKDVKDSDFFENLKIQFPTLEYTFKLNEAINLRKTTDHLYYFKVLSIILMVLGIIGAMLSI